MGWAAIDDDLKKKKFADEEEDEDDHAEDCDGCGLTTRHPPDGGYGWVVLFAAFVCNVIVDGIGFSFGTAQIHYMQVFNASFSQVSWVGSSLTGSYLIVGPIVGVLCCRIGLRKVTILGSVIAMTGFVLSSFATSLEMLALTYGVIGGVGLGLMYLPSIVCVSYWFEKRLGFATGIVVCGSGLGQFIFHPLGEYLTSEYQWQGKHLILGAIVLHGVVCGALFRPPDCWHHRRNKRAKQRVEIERGIIMKALIEDKKRQRTISDGSLDNCVITTNNRLIKLEPSLLHDKSQNLKKMLRQLGFSIQSLAVSKCSLQANSRVLIEHLQQSKIDNNSSANSKTNSPQFLQPAGVLQKRNSSPDFNKVSSLDQQQLPGGVIRSNSIISNGSVVSDGQLEDRIGQGVIPRNGTISNGTNSPVKGFPKTRSCVALSQLPTNILIKKLMSERVRSNSECVTTTHSSNNLPPPQMIQLGSSPTLPVGSVDISIQEISHSEAASSCYNSNTSIATDNTSQLTHDYVPNSSQNGFVTSSMISAQQLEASMRQLQRQEARENSKWYRWLQVAIDMMKLMCNPILALFLISSLFTLLAFFIPYTYIPSLALNLGLPYIHADFMISILAITSTVGRIVVGWLGDRPWINKLYLNNGALICAGVCSILLPFTKDSQMLCVMSAILGFCLAATIALRSLLLVKFLGVELFPKSFGLLCLFQGIAGFAGTPLAGELADRTGSLDVTFYMAGIFTLISGLILFPLNYLKKRQERVDAHQQAEEETDAEGCLMKSTGGVKSSVYCHA